VLGVPVTEVARRENIANALPSAPILKEDMTGYSIHPKGSERGILEMKLWSNSRLVSQLLRPIALYFTSFPTQMF
jgi:hypothetical protein